MTTREGESRRQDETSWHAPTMSSALLVSSATTGGLYCIVEREAPPAAGVARHIHRREDETLIIAAGCWLVDVGSRLRLARAGEVVHMPRGIPHEFRNVSSQSGRLLSVFASGNIEPLFSDECLIGEAEEFGIIHLTNRLDHALKTHQPRKLRSLAPTRLMPKVTRHVVRHDAPYNEVAP